MTASSRFLGSRRFIYMPRREEASLLARRWRNLGEPRNPAGARRPRRAVAVAFARAAAGDRMSALGPLQRTVGLLSPKGERIARPRGCDSLLAHTGATTARPLSVTRRTAYVTRMPSATTAAMTHGAALRGTPATASRNVDPNTNQKSVPRSTRVDDDEHATQGQGRCA
jgi:hypothetical protein